MACCIEIIDCVTHNMLSFSFRSVDANVSLGFAEVAREVSKQLNAEVRTHISRDFLLT